MKKDLAYVSDYFKALVIPHMPDDFVVAKPFRHGLTDGALRKGMEAFRDFLYVLFDKLAADKAKIDVKTGAVYDPHGTKGDRGTRSVKHCFPVFFDLTIILFSLGYHGRLDTETKTKLILRGADMLTVICPLTEKYQSVIRMSSERKLELFHLLADLGLRFEGADFSEEIDFAKTGTFHITYAHNAYLPIGFKLIAEAMVNNKYYIKLENLFAPLFLRGDFYSLQNATPKGHVIHINEYAQPQTPEIRQWVKQIDVLLIQNKCTMVRSDGAFQYIRRGKSVTHGMVCIIDMGITGCSIIPGVNHLANPNNILLTLPDDMANTLKSCGQDAAFDPEQCYRKTGNMGYARFAFTHNGEDFVGCRHAGLRCQFSGAKCGFTGYRFDLADPCVREWMKKWIELELEQYTA